MSKSFAVICEARADFATATELADRVLLAGIDWLDETLLEHQRTWLAELPAGAPLTWSALPERAREAGIRVRGHFDGQPGLPDAHAARRAIAYVLHLIDSIDAIVLIRDMDDQGVRECGLKQARTPFEARCKILIGAAKCEREAWVICGFEPNDDAEKERLASETRTLGCDPRFSSHELTAVKNDQVPEVPKGC